MWGDVAIGIVIICGANLFFGSILGFFGYLRYLKHKETIALAEAGLVASAPEKKPVADLRAVRSGIVLMFIGLALCIGLYPIGWIAMPGELPLNLGPWMLIGLIPLFIGLAQVIGNYVPGIQTIVGQGVQKVLDDSEGAQSANRDSMPIETAEKSEARSEMNV